MITSIFRKQPFFLIQSFLQGVQLRSIAATTNEKQLNSKPVKPPSQLSQSSTKKSEYLAADMYDYNLYSHYDLETSMSKYRLKQPSAFDKLIPDPPPPPKK
ncbi:unnamed protein product [Didymodactylos carnosus]|uniref:NADH dehydrogenase [ubiquinone] flavoprotein 3, mitochondrial n=1 Tax=Didymodactylos carnosus TaxID=1234261 RepID=A0A813XE03_9BILA|nr:unnamed protein product [Didymodactylos carnosus]CAF1240764.1 unnamed protein product [Didymodactylos carnosus]CAF3651474.1 unnamed protein product [Didymodactylos carnosus]CAF4048287.1 unnamed protein product [Didymodactylos carnosus]